MKIRIKNDKLFALNHKILYALRVRLHIALKGKSKSERTLKLVGCGIEELKSHLQSQFKEGMNWDNYGMYGWHIDHIRPCSSFELSKEEEQRKCFHYSNLQPLWAEENWIKNDKF